MKIEKLTTEQESQIAVYRDRYWRQAISTESADRPRAETAAKRLAEIGGLENCCVLWVANPIEGQAAYCEAYANLSVSLRDSLQASLSA